MIDPNDLDRHITGNYGEDSIDQMPIEERLLDRLRRLRTLTFPVGVAAMEIIAEVEDYLNQAITDRDHPNPWDCDHDTEHEFTDPFEDK